MRADGVQRGFALRCDRCGAQLDDESVAATVSAGAVKAALQEAENVAEAARQAESPRVAFSALSPEERRRRMREIGDELRDRSTHAFQPPGTP
jgi:acyl-CoA reductase-like NAD-dependent aldehyde dehydrogenase